MTIWYAQNSSVNIDSTNEWNDVANGSGNWLTWASLAAGDILCANAKTAIACNVDFTCLRISTAAEGSGSAGGGFTVSLASARTLTCNVLAGTTACLVSSGNTAAFVLNGNIDGGSAASAYGFNIGATAANKFTFNGNITGGSNSTAYGLYSTTGGANNPTVNGNVTGGTAAPGVYLGTTASDIITVNGVVTGGSGAAAYGVLMQGGFLQVGTNGKLVFTSGWVSPFSAARVKWAVADGANATITMYDTAGTPAAHVLYVPGYPADSAVWTGTSFDYGVHSGTKRASSIANCSAGNVKSGVTIDDVTGTYTGSAGTVIPHIIGA